MGQYHLTVNLDKRQFLDPHKLGDGLKLMEQVGSSEGGIGSALLLLLAVSNGRGGGDFHGDDTDGIIGSWGGDRIAVVGDYAESGDLPKRMHAEDIYGLCRIGQGQKRSKYRNADGSILRGRAYTDITERVRALLEQDPGLQYTGDGWVRRGYPQEVQ